ncbi:PEP-CTERM sorting domain-containing protein [Rhizorhabdus histidinilytica]
MRFVAPGSVGVVLHVEGSCCVQGGQAADDLCLSGGGNHRIEPGRSPGPRRGPQGNPAAPICQAQDPRPRHARRRRPGRVGRDAVPDGHSLRAVGPAGGDPGPGRDDPAAGGRGAAARRCGPADAANLRAAEHRQSQSPSPGVPEPSTWVQLMLGFALIGGVARVTYRKNGTAPEGSRRLSLTGLDPSRHPGLRRHDGCFAGMTSSSNLVFRTALHR